MKEKGNVGGMKKVPQFSKISSLVKFLFQKMKPQRERGRE